MKSEKKVTRLVKMGSKRDVEMSEPTAVRDVTKSLSLTLIYQRFICGNCQVVCAIKCTLLSTFIVETGAW